MGRDHKYDLLPPDPTSDVLADDLRRRDLVENKALEWYDLVLMFKCLVCIKHECIIYKRYVYILLFGIGILFKL